MAPKKGQDGKKTVRKKRGRKRKGEAPFSKTAADIIRREVLAGTRTGDILKQVREKFPKSKATQVTVSHYRTKLRNLGFDVPRPSRKKTSPAGKPAAKRKPTQSPATDSGRHKATHPAKSAPKTGKTVAVACDHAGVELKSTLKSLLAEQGITVIDLGTDGKTSVDYPDFANALAQSLAWGEAQRGILICGSGVGISIAANRHRHIRAALCTNGLMARLARQHNDANVLVLGSRLTGEDIAKDCVLQFLNTPFEGGRHTRRVDKLT